MKMDSKWNVGSAYFSVQVVTAKINQTRRYCSREFKADLHLATRNAWSADHLIVKNAVLASSVQAAKKVH